MTGDWQPIETCPRGERVWLWIVPKTAQETYYDTSGNPIVSNHTPYRREGTYGSWGALSKAIYWHPLPADPMTRAQETR